MRPANAATPHPACVAVRGNSTAAAVSCSQQNTRDGARGDNGYDCSQPNCNDARPYCSESSAAGVRARQICPVTCGCDQPRSSLALFLPESGCPRVCRKSTNYRTALATIPCTDVAVNDSRYVAFLDEWTARDLP